MLSPSREDHRHLGHGAGAHDHHHHAHGGADFGFAFACGVVLNLGFVVAEATYGIIANSVALLADAGHNLGDVLGLAAAWAAAILMRRHPSDRFTYGLRSSSILAALFNVIVLLIAVGAIILEAINQLVTPAPIASRTVVVVAAVGILVNGGTALLFRHSHGDLNARAAFLHLLADAAVSLGVVIAGALILLTGWLWLDPAASLVIALVIVLGTWQLLRKAMNMALHAVPPGIDPGAVRAHLDAIAGVVQVHDLHIWPMSTTETALTCHLVMPEGHPGDRVLTHLAHELHERFGIDHATIQVETGDPDHPCKLVPDHVV
jgi:cobalt-zinc-cadmium efflux system protein